MKGGILAGVIILALVVSSWFSTMKQNQLQQAQLDVIRSQTAVNLALARAVEVQALAAADVVRAQAVMYYALAAAVFAMVLVVFVLAFVVIRMTAKQNHGPVYLPQQQETQLEPGSSLIVWPHGLQVEKRRQNVPLGRG